MENLYQPRHLTMVFGPLKEMGSSHKDSKRGSQWLVQGIERLIESDGAVMGYPLSYTLRQAYRPLSLKNSSYFSKLYRHPLFEAYCITQGIRAEPLFDAIEMAFFLPPKYSSRMQRGFEGSRFLQGKIFFTKDKRLCSYLQRWFQPDGFNQVKKERYFKPQFTIDGLI